MQAVLYGPNGLPLNPQAPAIVDPTFNALRTSLKPVEYQYPGQLLGHYKASFIWSNVAAATGSILSLRWSPQNANAVMVPMRIRWTHAFLTTVFTTQQYIDLAATVARTWASADTGGSSLIPSTQGSNRVRSTMGASQLYATGQVLAATAAITAGTRTLDSQPFCQLAADVNSNTLTTGGTPLITSPKELYVHLPGADNPVVLAQNEGIVFTVPNGLGAAGVVKWGVQLEWLEALAY